MIVTPEARIQEYTANGWWGAETLVDMLYKRARSAPDTLALVDPLNKMDLMGIEPARLTYDQTIAAIDKLAARFIELGLKHDDVILAQLPNSTELILTMFAAARAGGIVSPVPFQWRKHEIEHAVTLTQARFVITSHNLLGFDHLTMIREALGENSPVRHYLTVGGGPAPDAIQMSDILAGPTADPSLLEGRQTSANEVFTLCWTSGTEAAPKAVPRSHNHWIAIGRAVAESFLPDQECVVLSLFPTINMAGLAGVMVPWVFNGGKMVLHHPFDLGIFLKQLMTEQVYYTLAPPALLDALAKSPQWAAMDKGNLKVIGSGSAPLSVWMVKTFQEQFGIGIVNFFGSNEGLALYSAPKDFPNPEDRARYFPRFGVAGLNCHSDAAKGFRTRLVNPVTEEEITQPGVTGELRFAGPTIFNGYYKSPELTRRAFDEQGYYMTGDLFSIAGDNLEKYQFEGRHKDLIIRGGMNISPEEIESLVVGHPKVAEVAAVGFPDDRLGERICIVVAPVKGETITLEDINEFLKEKDIAKYKYPEVLKIVPTLPRNSVGKVLKRELRSVIKQDS
jgi:acyl-CoA synthetase (AMP-forming)/AMP-acid ligase II